MLHALNPIRVGWIKAHISLTDKKGVDLGCGGGILTETLAHAGGQMSGVDLNETALEQARAHAKAEKLDIHYFHEPIENFANAHAGTFDVVTCMELLEHVPSPESIIEAAAKLLKPNGIVFFSTINRQPKAYLKAVVAAEYVLGLLPRGTHDYQKFIKPSELVNEARKHELELIALNGVDYQPFTKTFSLTDSPDVNYLIAFRKK